jgi:hypothetical protein
MKAGIETNKRAGLEVYDVGKGGDDFWCEMRPVS